MTAAGFPDGALQPVLKLLTAGGRRSRGRKKVRARRWVKTPRQLWESSCERCPENRWCLQKGQEQIKGWSSRSNQCLTPSNIRVCLDALLLLLLLCTWFFPQKQYFPGCSAIHRWQPPRLKAFCLIFLCYILFISSSDVREYIFAVGKSHICVVFAEAMMSQVSSIADVFPLNILWLICLLPSSISASFILTLEPRRAQTLTPSQFPFSIVCKTLN